MLTHENVQTVLSVVMTSDTKVVKELIDSKAEPEEIVRSLEFVEMKLWSIIADYTHNLVQVTYVVTVQLNEDISTIRLNLVFNERSVLVALNYTTVIQALGA